ncbi:MAG TPA: radical SAM protein [Candidatus Omnitrophota bacterium]|nr:radical SAM protein [Candidatus Omnitrophota bacterium]HPT07463.1 radical SAM protein [Candidatus Omnitrophota bacterium]
MQIIQKTLTNYAAYKKKKEKNAQLLADDIKEKRSIVRALPTDIALITDPLCNLRCIMCTQGPLNEKCAQALPYIEEKHLIRFAEEVFPTAQALYLNNAGEPLLSRNLDLEVELAERYGVMLKVITNGTVFNPCAARVQRIIKNASSVIFSFDSPSKKIYESIRVGANFKEVKRHMRLFNQYRKKLPAQNRPLFGITMILMKRNAHEVLPMIRFAKEIGADFLTLKNLIPIVPTIKPESLSGDTEKNFMLISAAKLSKKLNLRLLLPALFDTNAGMCAFPWKYAYIDDTCNIHACCAIKRPIPGNIRTSDFKSIWNNPIYIRLRQTFTGGRPHPYCAACIKNGIFREQYADFAFVTC